MAKYVRLGVLFVLGFMGLLCMFGIYNWVIAIGLICWAICAKLGKYWSARGLLTDDLNDKYI